MADTRAVTQQHLASSKSTGTSTNRWNPTTGYHPLEMFSSRDQVPSSPPPSDETVSDGTSWTSGSEKDDDEQQVDDRSTIPSIAKPESMRKLFQQTRDRLANLKLDNTKRLDEIVNLARGLGQDDARRKAAQDIRARAAVSHVGPQERLIMRREADRIEWGVRGSDAQRLGQLLAEDEAATRRCCEFVLGAFGLEDLDDGEILMRPSTAAES